QDGLVHVSALADRFVKDPREVVKSGDVVKVKVLEVDLKRKRIALTMRMSDQPGAAKQNANSNDKPLAQRDRKFMTAEAPRPQGRGWGGSGGGSFGNASSGGAFGGALAAAFAKAGVDKRK